jgi:hypothetical protein
MTPTPLSDRITALVERYSDDHYRQFLSVFLRSRVGVHILNPPPNGEAPMRAAMGHAPDGTDGWLLVYADPVAFVERFGQPFNADLDGEAALQIIAANPASRGVLVNSAASQSCVPIVREQALLLVPPPEEPSLWTWFLDLFRGRSRAG